MKIDYNTLKKTWPGAVFINFVENIEFDHVNIATIENETVSEEKHHLFFALSDTKPEVNGWYVKPFDRKSYFPKITFDKPHWSFVVNENIDISLINKSVRIIIVKSVTQATKDLLKYVLDLVKPKVCAVTGSVGKTTCAALIEQMLSLKYNCVRIFAKRISPPILCTAIINKIDLDTQFIVLEMALWRKDHIQVLARLLPPTIGVILNIKDVHIGVEGINNKEDILESKSQIAIGAIPIINIDDPLLLGKFKDDKNAVTFAMENTSADVFIDQIDVITNEVQINIKGFKIKFRPFLLTKLTLYQVLAACCVSITANVSLSDIASHISNLKPKENRLVKLKFNNYRILFDGERTLDARIDELAENLYHDATLIIYRFEENYPLDLNNFLSIFSKFTRVYILEDFTNREQLSFLELPSNTKFVKHSDLLVGIPEDSVIFFHYSVYYRTPELKDKNPLFLLEHLNR
ncbi:MAG: UDP-N-acetylmuramoyl-tripeptide--D-alanyl-D-alanine ligase [Mucilaginibacter sp.]|nr:UDP-N-acetylmuramoyl-tripeptide--D-alanyl-D-alanine ligase [Mucilaginibacter sp.]